MKTVKIFGKTIPLLAIIAIVTVASVIAAGTIYSTIVQVTVEDRPIPPEFVLTLTEPGESYTNEFFQLTGTLTFDDDPIAGATITVNKVTSTGDLIGQVSSAQTQADGTYTAQVKETTADTYYYRASYDTT